MSAYLFSVSAGEQDLVEVVVERVLEEAPRTRWPPPRFCWEGWLWFRFCCPCRVSYNIKVDKYTQYKLYGTGYMGHKMGLVEILD